MISTLLEILKALCSLKWLAGLFSQWRTKHDAQKISDIDAAPADSVDDTLNWLHDDAERPGK